MKISLITPTYNSAQTITRTIDSVLAQNYADLECIIIDGASTDNTKELVLSYQDRLNIKFISEPDKGIYDAMNKGVALATGEIVGILNSDDLFDNDQVLLTVSNAFSDASIQAVYGDLKYFSSDVSVTKRYWRAGAYQETNLNNGWIIPHPSLFLRKSVYNQCGLYNTDFKIAGDYEFILRLLKIHKVKTKYLPEVLVRMYDGGTSGSNLEQRQKGWVELKKAWLVNNFKLPRFFILRRVLFKISQLIFK
jgi:glycosyltransferase